MTQLAVGLDRKQRGQDRMECADAAWIAQARGFARGVSIARGSVTSDAIQLLVRDGEIDAPINPQSFGCIFRGRHWMYMGMTPTTIATGHGRRITVWRWID